MIRRRYILVVPATAIVAALIAVLVAGGPESDGNQATSAQLGAKCSVFPEATGVAPDAPSLPDQRAWNQDISGAPVRQDSDQIIDYINSHGDSELHPDFGSPRIYGIPFKVVGQATRPVRVRFTAYGDESDKGKYRIPLSAPIEGGAKSDGDRHVIGYDKDRCKLYELYRAFPKRKQHRWNADAGVIWNLRSAGLRKDGWTSADAAGLPIFPGLVRFSEVQAGEIDHALRVTFDSTRDAWIHPASHCAGDTNAAHAPPMGLRLRLKRSYDTSALTGQSAVIAAALKRYGVINADNGSNWYFQGASSRNWNDDNLNQLKAIPGSAFEVVQSEAPDTKC
jgi:hypothetical protein